MPKTVFSGAHRHLVELLVAARRKAGLTQSELASLIGKDQKFISLIERGQRRVDVLEFYVLAKAMGLEPLKMYGDLVRRLPVEIDI
jgi:transcriptional regulator with XRE-family HTH domain